MLHDLEALCRSYEAACASMDAEAICGFYAYPCLIGVSDAQFSYASREQMQPAFAWVLAGYRRLGVVTSRIADLSIEILSLSYANADLRWHLSDAEGRTLPEMHCTYLIRRVGDLWRIVVAISHDEDQGAADRANAGSASRDNRPKASTRQLASYRREASGHSTAWPKWRARNR